MSERLTVVFDDSELARRLKVVAAERGVPQKRIIEDALRAYLGPDPKAEPPAFDWAAFDAWQAEVEAREAEYPSDGPDDLSDVKQHLYQLPPRGPLMMVAEERATYDAGQ